MSDFFHTVYTVLFNPNHEFSLPIFLIIAFACIATSSIARYMAEKNAEKHKNDVKGQRTGNRIRKKR